MTIPETPHPTHTVPWTSAQIQQLIDVFLVMRDKGPGWLTLARGTARPTAIALGNEATMKLMQLDKMLSEKRPELYTPGEREAVAAVLVAHIAIIAALTLHLTETGVIDPELLQ